MNCCLMGVLYVSFLILNVLYVVQVYMLIIFLLGEHIFLFFFAMEGKEKSCTELGDIKRWFFVLVGGL